MLSSLLLRLSEVVGDEVVKLCIVKAIAALHAKIITIIVLIGDSQLYSFPVSEKPL